MAVLKGAALLLAVGAAAGPASVPDGLDSQGLVQQVITAQSPNPVARLPKHKRLKEIESKLVPFGVALMVLDGKRWSKFLFENSTLANQTTAEAVCTEEDRKGSMDAFDGMFDSLGTLPEKLEGKVKEGISGLFGSAMKDGIGGLFGAGALPAMANLGKKSDDNFIGNLLADLGLPKACQGIMSSDFFTMAGLSSCFEQALHVSSTCLNCFPRFGQTVAEKCVTSCKDELTSASTAFSDKLPSIMTQAATSFLTQQDQQEAMTQVIEKAMEVFLSAVEQLKPCAMCIEQPVMNFVGCLAGPTIEGEVQNGFDQLIGALSSGTLLNRKTQLAGNKDKHNED